MSLPRSNYDPRRVCLNPFPEFSLGPHKRTAGIYIAGALVRSHAQLLAEAPSLTRTFKVCHRQLDVHRRRSPLSARGAIMGWSSASSCHLRRLAPWHQCASWDARGQPD